MDGAIPALIYNAYSAVGARDEIKPGDDVAARIHTKEGINWILAKVREARSNGKYDVRPNRGPS